MSKALTDSFSDEFFQALNDELNMPMSIDKKDEINHEKS
jgi:hypothetical protein